MFGMADMDIQDQTTCSLQSDLVSMRSAKDLPVMLSNQSMKICTECTATLFCRILLAIANAYISIIIYAVPHNPDCY